MELGAARFVFPYSPSPLCPPSAAGGSLRAVCGGVCRSGAAEEPNPGGAFLGSCCGAHPAGPGDVHRVRGGHGGIPEGQQDPAAHGRDAGRGSARLHRVNCV